MKALITGIDGFVGNYLTANLLNDGYEVYGTSIIPNYKKDNVKIFNMDLLDKNRVLEVISEVKPDLLITCFGCPKQEKFIYENIRRCNERYVSRRVKKYS